MRLLHGYYVNWMGFSSTLTVQSLFNNTIYIHVYHHSTKVYWKITWGCCRLYCYECVIKLTMPTTRNEWCFFFPLLYRGTIVVMVLSYEPSISIVHSDTACMTCWGEPERAPHSASYPGSFPLFAHAKKSLGTRLPHTSETALQDTCVCFVCMFVCGHIPEFKLSIKLLKLERSRSVWKKPGVKMTQVNAHMVTADHDGQGQAVHRRCRQITHSSCIRFR